MKLKILFNCSTNTVGGGVKNSALFIQNALLDDSIEWIYAVSPQVRKTLDNWGLDTSTFHVFESSPAKCKNARKRLAGLPSEFGCEAVFTMAGPSYVGFGCTHVMGMSEPYVSHAGWEAIRKGRSLKGVAKVILLTIYKAYFAKKADYWIFQTDYSREQFSKRYLTNECKTTTVFNAIDLDIVQRFSRRLLQTVNTTSPITIMCPGGPYVHKAFDSIPATALELKKLSKGEVDFRFLFTIDESSMMWKHISTEAERLGVKGLIDTTGAYDYSDVSNILSKADLVYVPSILETFSASYIEAFAIKVPLICANRHFAKDVCGNAALYVEPYEPMETANSILRLITDKDSQLKLIKEGSKQLLLYGDQGSRFKNIRQILKKVCSSTD